MNVSNSEGNEGVSPENTQLDDLFSQDYSQFLEQHYQTAKHQEKGMITLQEKPIDEQAFNTRISSQKICIPANDGAYQQSMDDEGRKCDQLSQRRSQGKDLVQKQNIGKVQGEQAQMNPKIPQIANFIGTTAREKGTNFNVFSNSFDESGALQMEMRPQRNCKSSTRMMNKTQNHGHVNHAKQSAQQQQFPIPLLQNIGGSSSNNSGSNKVALLTSGSLNKKQEVFNNYMKSKQNSQNQYQQAIINQLSRGTGGNSIDVKATGFTQPIVNQGIQDLSDRSQIDQMTGNYLGMTTPYALIPSNYSLYGGGGSSGTLSKPITPHQNPGNSTQIFQSVILSAGSGGKGNSMNQQTPQSQSHNMDPYTYFRWKQQKYKSSRSINNGNGCNYGGVPQNQNQRQDVAMNNSAQINPSFQNRGNQTQKNNKSFSSSGNGSIINTSSTGLTHANGGQPIKSLNDVSNPQYFISLRYFDRKVSDLKGISKFKNLSELDISGNLLTSEIPELKQLQFLKKLNLSNNHIENIYSLPSNLEILNLSYNKLKVLQPEVTQTMKNIITLDITSNGLESLDGVQNMRRLKRLLSKNNQIQELGPLKDIETLIEIDLENNPVDNYIQLLAMLANKKDILVVNLRLSPVFLTISSYDQLCSEIEIFINRAKTDSSQSSLEIPTSLIDSFKNRLKYYVSGCLYRSKRAYLKMRALQQNSKRSSSNFSNGSSSCGRGGAHTGGRLPGNLTGHAPFSPLLNPNVSTPNQGQHVTQRLEDLEQTYDEILDEEEEHERKLLRIQRRKLKKLGVIDPNNIDDDSGDEEYEESMSMYEEDEEDIHPTMSFDEDIDDLQSYRNHGGVVPHEGHHDILNESTADFNKEIKQINQELREQLGNDLGMPSNIMPDQLQSFQSTQSLKNVNTNKNSAENSQANTQKKNPISFKLDLSKCTNQQSEDDEDDDFGDALGEDMQDQLEIPGLQFVKVTDDSFRQYSKHQPQLSSVRSKVQIKDEPELSNRKLVKAVIQKEPVQPQPIQQSLPEQLPQKQQLPPKQIIIPKLQLGILQQQHNIPMKQAQVIQQSQQNITLQSLRSDKQSEKAKIITKEPDSVQREEQKGCESCTALRKTLRDLKSQYQSENEASLKEIKILQSVVSDIKAIFKFSARSDILSLPGSIRAFKQQTEAQQEQANLDIFNLRQKCDTLTQRMIQDEGKAQENSHDLFVHCQENERTIMDLKEQISKLMNTQSQPQIMTQFPDYSDLLSRLDDTTQSTKTLPLHSIELKRLNSNEEVQQKKVCLLNNPAYFYNSSHAQSSGRAKEDDKSVEVITKKRITNATDKAVFTQQNCKKVKRPQSVVTGINQRRSSQGFKGSNILRIDPSQINASGSQGNFNSTNLKDDTSCGANEYCSNQELLLPLDISKINAIIGGVIDSKNTPLSQTMNKKVGHYLQRLKERNSSLQERLNGSFRDGSGSHSALNIITSPLPQSSNIIQIHQQQDSILTNPYILSPSNHRYNESISSCKLPSQQNPSNQITYPPNTQYQSLHSITNPSKQLSNQNQYQNASQSTQGQTQGKGKLRKVSSKEPNNNNRRSSQYASNIQVQPIDQHSKAHVNRFSINEYSERMKQQAAPQNNNAGLKQHSKTQRIHVNRVQYNQLIGAVAKQADNKVSEGYQTQQQHVNLTSLFSGRGLIRTDSSEHTVERQAPNSQTPQAHISNSLNNRNDLMQQ